jgi:hypothetical protein
MLLTATTLALLALLPAHHPLRRRSHRLLSTLALAGTLRMSTPRRALESAPP